MEIEPVGAQVLANGKILSHHLPLTRNGSSLDPVGPLISDTLTRHLPLEWKGIPLEPVGPAVLHVERIVNHHIPLEWNGQPLPKTWEEHKFMRETLSRHLPLEIEPVGPTVITTWQLALAIIKLIKDIKIDGCDLTPLIERVDPLILRIGELEKGQRKAPWLSCCSGTDVVPPVPIVNLEPLVERIRELESLVRGCPSALCHSQPF